MQMLANGHYLMLGYEYVTMNLSAYHWFSGNGSPGDTNARVKCGIIQELDANKSPVFTWRAYEHFDFSDVQEARLLDPHDVDWTHCNAVEVDRDSNFILSSRFFSEVTKIDRQSGNIIWRMNGKRNQFLFSNDPYAGFYGQHDPRRITNGNITLFDNGKAGNPIRPARALEYAVDETSRTANLVWSHTFASNANSGQMGNVQRLGNANTVIGWGGLRNANVALSCVKPNGVTVLHVSFPDTSITYRAFNYPTLPWKLNRPVISCITSGSNHFLDAGAGHGSYLWSTGDTTQTIQILAPGEYQVFVPYGNGGYISSERKLITSMTHPCDLDSAASTTVSFTIATGWNLVSLPVSVVDSSVAVLFPSSASEAFSYSGQYVAGTSMVNRVGYWLKFDTAGQVTVNGVSRSTDTMDVAQGWNLIGSIGTPVATADITSLPGGIVTSSFFSYDVGYSITDSIIPGKGYWVKSSTSGKLVLSSTGSVRASSRIRIEMSREFPPSPPDVDGHAYPTSL